MTPELPPPWVFAEFSPVGVDLDSPTSGERYDDNQGADAAADDRLLARLGVEAGTVLVDLGTGTGSLPIQAALRGAVAHGIDVSLTMLNHARRRAEQAAVTVELQRAGLLSHRTTGDSVDVATTRSALHQLPDAWKQVALRCIADMLRPGGILYIWDVIWSFSPAQATDQLAAWIEAMTAPTGPGFTRTDFETHVREEFSTFGWVLEGLIERAGLEITEATYPSPWYGEIVARKAP